MGYKWWIDLMDSFRLHPLKVELLFLLFVESFSYLISDSPERYILVNTQKISINKTS